MEHCTQVCNDLNFPVHMEHCTQVCNDLNFPAHMEHCTDVRNDLLQPTALDQLTTESFDDSNCNSITNLWTCCTPASKQNKNTCNVIDTDPKNSDQLNNTDQSFAGNAIRLLQKPQFNKSRQNYVDTDSKIMVKIACLNEYITCGVCRGYLFEAATITECMHSCKFFYCLCLLV